MLARLYMLGPSLQHSFFVSHSLTQWSGTVQLQFSNGNQWPWLSVMVITSATNSSSIASSSSLLGTNMAGLLYCLAFNWPLVCLESAAKSILGYVDEHTPLRRTSASCLARVYKSSAGDTMRVMVHLLSYVSTLCTHGRDVNICL